MTQKIQNFGLFIAIGSTVLIPNIFFDKFAFFVLSVGLLLTFLIYSHGKILSQPVKTIMIIAVIFNLSLILSGMNTNRSFTRILVGEWNRNLGLLHYFGLTTLLIFTIFYFNELLLQRIIVSLSLLGFAFILVGYFQVFILMNDPNSSQKNGITLTLGNSNFAAVALTLTSVATLFGIFSNSFLTFKFIFSVLSFIFQVFLIFQTKTLQGITLLCSAIFILFFLHLIYRPKRRIHLSPSLLITIFVTVISTTVIVFIKIGIDKVFANLSSSLLDRYYHWVAAVNMIKSNPIFGVGIDAFGDSYRLYRIPEAIALRGDPYTFANNAHNIYFQLGSTAGMATPILYLMMNLYILWRGINALEKNRGNLSLQVIFVLWLVFQTQLLISIDQLGLAPWGWLLSGTIIAVSFFDKEQKLTHFNPVGAKLSARFSVKRAVLVYGIYLTVVGIVIIPGIRSEFRVSNAISKINSTTSQSGFQIEASNLYNAGKNSSQPGLRVKAILELFKVQQVDRALELAQAGVRDFPADIAIWDCLASIYEFQGNYEAAILARRTTVALDPLNQNLVNRLEKDLAEVNQLFYSDKNQKTT